MKKEPWKYRVAQSSYSHEEKTWRSKALTDWVPSHEEALLTAQSFKSAGMKDLVLQAVSTESRV